MILTTWSGLWTSADGVNWTHNKTIPAGAVIQSPPNKIGDTYYLGTWQNGLWTSADGVNWTKDTHGLKGDYRFEEPPTKIGDTYYVGSQLEGLFGSKDGKTWKLLVD